MLAADAELDVRTRLAAALGGKPDQFADAVLVDRHEGIGFEQAARRIGTEEGAGIVAADAERGLRQVVGAEGEELALAAISSARSAARGSSIMVPT